MSIAIIYLQIYVCACWSVRSVVLLVCFAFFKFVSLSYICTISDVELFLPVAFKSISVDDVALIQ